MPDGKVLSKLYHGSAGVAREGGLSQAQFGVLRACSDGWEWSHYMPKPEGSDKTPTTSRYRVPMVVRVTDWDELMWIVRVDYMVTEGGMVSVRITAPRSRSRA